MPRFLHTADWQIGRQYRAFPDADAFALAEARFAAVERIAALAAAERADAVLVAGDVFDAQTLADRTVRRLFHALAAFPGPWVLLPGNHDAALAEGVWAQARRLGAVPPNVHLALAPAPLRFDGAGLVVLPAPLLQRHTHADLTAWFDAAETPPNLARVGLAHGCVQGLLADGIDAANPIAADRAAAARLDHLALGDWHGTRRIDDRTWYSGTPEPDRFRDNGAGQALWVEIDAPGAPARVRPVAVGRHRWRTLSHALDVPSDFDRLVEALAALDATDVVQLVVAGRTDLAGRARLKRAVAEAEGRVRSLRLDDGALRLDPTADDIAALHADGYVGEVVAELRDAQRTAVDDAGEDADALLARDALLELAEVLTRRRRQSEAAGATTAARQA